MDNKANAQKRWCSCVSRSSLSIIHYQLSIIHYPLSIIAALLLYGCGGPKIIPDRELARIFHDIYLVNGYANQTGLAVDSLNIYEPVLASYGYTSEDVQYTIGNFAKRKSARLSTDVVEVAIELLRSEGSRYRRRIEMRDTISLIARLRSADTVYYNPRIAVRRTADTSRLRVLLGDVRPGSYRVSWSYTVDSLDRNLSLRYDAWLVDTAGRRSGINGQRLEREHRATGSLSFTATDAHRRLSISLGGYSRDMTTPRITIDSLTVIHYLPDHEAVRRLSRSLYSPGGPGSRGDEGDRLIDSLVRRMNPWNPHKSEDHETHIVAPLIDTARTRSR